MFYIVNGAFGKKTTLWVLFMIMLILNVMMMDIIPNAQKIIFYIIKLCLIQSTENLVQSDLCG